MKKALCYLKMFGKIVGIGVIGISCFSGILVGYITLCEMTAKKLAPLLGMEWYNIAPIFIVGGLTLGASVAITIVCVQESGCCESKPKKKLKNKKGK